MLGKTYMAMKDKERALLWLRKAKDYPARTQEDKEVHSRTKPHVIGVCVNVAAGLCMAIFVCFQAHKEAVELLKKLG